MHTNFIQRDAMDCGPSCLAIIAEYYGVHMNIIQLRELCGIGHNGVSLLGISKAAEQIGLKTIGGRLSFDTLVSDITLPCIAHWNQNHFVVIKKIKETKSHNYAIEIIDPAKGILIFNKDDFLPTLD